MGHYSPRGPGGELSVLTWSISQWLDISLGLFRLLPLESLLTSVWRSSDEPPVSLLGRALVNPSWCLSYDAHSSRLVEDSQWLYSSALSPRCGHSSLRPPEFSLMFTIPKNPTAVLYPWKSLWHPQIAHQLWEESEILISVFLKPLYYNIKCIHTKIIKS